MLALRKGDVPRALPDSVRDAMRWTAAQLDEGMLRAMSDWPPTVHVQHASLGTILFCHATPRNDVDIFTRRTPEDRLRQVFESADADVVVCGHTHMQFDRLIGDVRAVNAGSVGMPFQAAGAYWALIGDRIELRRTTYDFLRAAEQIRATGYPQAAEFAERYVLHPPSEEETLARFSAFEAKPS
jgi:diadenosine tetraphosphatase ApaH/serine/threonine PP2A family protein phosphatase